jgi:hypothetical protein
VQTTGTADGYDLQLCGGKISTNEMGRLADRPISLILLL